MTESRPPDREVERKLRVHALFRHARPRRVRSRTGRHARSTPGSRGSSTADRAVRAVYHDTEDLRADPLGRDPAPPRGRSRRGLAPQAAGGGRAARACATRCACPWTPASPGRSPRAMADVVTALARRNPLVPVATLHTAAHARTCSTTPTARPWPSSSTTSCRSWTARSWPAGSASSRSEAAGRRPRPCSTRSSTSCWPTARCPGTASQGRQRAGPGGQGRTRTWPSAPPVSPERPRRLTPCTPTCSDPRAAVPAAGRAGPPRPARLGAPDAGGRPTAAQRPAGVLAAGGPDVVAPPARRAGLGRLGARPEP